MIANSSDWPNLPDPDRPSRGLEDSPEEDRESSDPTPRQIQERAARIRRGWNEAKKKSRSVQPNDERWQPPRISAREWNEESTPDTENQ